MRNRSSQAHSEHWSKHDCLRSKLHNSKELDLRSSVFIYTTWSIYKLNISTTSWREERWPNLLSHRIHSRQFTRIKVIKNFLIDERIRRLWNRCKWLVYRLDFIILLLHLRLIINTVVVNNTPNTTINILKPFPNTTLISTKQILGIKRIFSLLINTNRKSLSLEVIGSKTTDSSILSYIMKLN